MDGCSAARAGDGAAWPSRNLRLRREAAGGWRVERSCRPSEEPLNAPRTPVLVPDVLPRPVGLTSPTRVRSAHPRPAPLPWASAGISPQTGRKVADHHNLLSSFNRQCAIENRQFLCSPTQFLRPAQPQPSVFATHLLPPQAVFGRSLLARNTWRGGCFPRLPISP